MGKDASIEATEINLLLQGCSVPHQMVAKSKFPDFQMKFL